MNCILHRSLPLQYFCETCMDPICQQCIKSNPHSNEYHRICPIEQAVHKRKENFYSFIQSSINPLRQKIRQKLQYLQKIQSRQLQYRNVIQKDIQLDFEAIDHRLKQKSEKKTLQYHTEIKYYQAYLNSLDDIVYTFDKTSSDPYNFLILYQDIQNQLKNLQLKQIRQKISNFDLNNQSTHINQGIEQAKTINQQVLTENTLQKLQQQLDLPRQFKKTEAKLSTLQATNERNFFINELIAKACKNYKDKQIELISKAQLNYKQKLKIFNKTNKSILELSASKACAYCGLTFSIQTLNDHCSQNKSARVQVLKQYSHITIQPQFKGTKRHYWVDTSVIDRKVPDPNGHALLRKKQKEQFLNSIKDLQIVKCCFRDFQIENASVDSKNKTAQIPNFIEVFKNVDKQNDGFLSKITFKYILTKIFLMNPIHCDVLTQLLAYKWKIVQKQAQNSKQNLKMQQIQLPQKEQVKKQPNEGVNYLLLQQFVKNPQFLYKQWEKMEEEFQKSKPVGPATKDINKFRSRY